MYDTKSETADARGTKSNAVIGRLSDSINKLDSIAEQIKNKINLINSEEIPSNTTSESAAKSPNEPDFLQTLHNKISLLEQINNRLSYCYDKLNQVI